VHIGLNLIFLVPGETGGLETYARELIPALLEQAPAGTRFTIFINREAAAAGDRPWNEALPTVTVPVNARNRVQWVLGEQFLLPSLAMRAQVDLVHSLGSTAPAWGRFRRVVTIHDVIYERFPDAHEGLRDKGMRVLVPLAVRRSHSVIAISQRTREDLIELLGTPSEKIAVVTQGLGSARAPAPIDPRQIRLRFALGERPLLLSLSAKRPHKNLGALIGALALIPAERRPVLVLPGYPTEHEAELRERVRSLGLQEDVRFPGWLAREEVEGLWDVATAFVYPSLYEGFGLPVLEAMARGVPVACADASSLPEVAGDAAVLFDPYQETAIAKALRRLVEDDSLRAVLRARGLARAAEFTWERTARATLSCYERTLAGRSLDG
jgi:glycosyltransferase involved in cell wall biosynthesis